MVGARPKQVVIQQHHAMDPGGECLVRHDGEYQHGNRQRRGEAQSAHQRRHAEHVVEPNVLRLLDGLPPGVPKHLLIEIAACEGRVPNSTVVSKLS